MNEYAFTVAIALHLGFLLFKFCRTGVATSWGILAAAWAVIAVECFLAIDWHWGAAARGALLLGLVVPAFVLAIITTRKFATRLGGAV